jgi:predicted GNAT family acetyltransferase
LVEWRAGAAEDDAALDLIGFLAYKTWGPPAPGVSIGAVGVSSKHRGKGYGRQLMKVAEDRAALLGIEGALGFVPGEVRLRSFASAVQFYERIGYERIEEDDDDDEDAPCVPMVRRCAPFSPRTAQRMASLLSPKQDPWSPKRSRALEDGPTWPSVQNVG